MRVIVAVPAGYTPAQLAHMIPGEGSVALTETGCFGRLRRHTADTRTVLPIPGARRSPGEGIGLATTGGVITSAGLVLAGIEVEQERTERRSDLAG